MEKLYGRFCTAKGAEMAQQRRAIAAAFYEALLNGFHGAAYNQPRPPERGF